MLGANCDKPTLLCQILTFPVSIIVRGGRLLMFGPIQYRGKSSGHTESLVGDFLVSIADIS